jgi:2-methylcitrate dehydratase PrpD
VSGNFGAAVAAASIMGLDEQRVRYVLSYAVQQASGSLNWIRDEQHVEKAFVYGGMPARNGVTAAVFARMGFPGVHDPFAGRPNYLYFFTHDVNKPKALIDGLGSRFYILENVIKKYAVGGPIQGPLDGLLMMMEKHRFAAQDVAAITVSLSDEAMRVVNDSDMPNVNLQYNLATALCDGKSTYASTISHERMNDPVIVDLRKRIRIVHEPAFDELKKRRYSIVDVILNNGAQWCEQITAIRGSPANPMTTAEVEAKATEYIGAVLGKDRSQMLIEKMRRLEDIGDVRELRDYISHD